MQQSTRPVGLLALVAVLLSQLFLAAPAGAAEALSVESLLPAGRVERLTQVVARFSRAMVPLGTAAQPPQDAPLRLDPGPAGAYRWLDPQTLAYILDPPLTGATRLSVTVPAGTRALDGAALAAPVEVKIHTPPVLVTEFDPKAGQALPPEATIRLLLNQPVDLASLQRAIRFTAAGASLPVEVSEEPPPQWRPERERLARAYLVRPKGVLSPAGRARLAVGPGVRPAQGNLPSERGFAADYLTYGPLSLDKWRMDRAPEGGLNPAAPLVLEFNNPVSPAKVWQSLVFDPPVPEPEAASWTEPTPSLYLELGLKPRTTYRVTLKAGLEDAYGTRLAADAAWELATGDLPPALILPGGQGVLESTGPPQYPMQVRNVGQVRASAVFLPPDAVVAALTAEAERPWDAKPPEPQAGQPGVSISTLKLDPPPNRLVYRPLDLPSLLGRSPAGGLTLLDLRASWPDDQGQLRQQVRRTLVQFTDLGLTLKLGTSGGAAWVTRLSDGAPLPGVDLELRDRDDRLLWSGRSDEQGLARLPGLDALRPAPDKKQPWRDPVVYLLARREGDFAVLGSDWNWQARGDLPRGFYLAGPVSRPPLAAHAVTQLPLYQPGQTVRLAVYLRQQAPQGLTAVAGRAAEVLVRDPQGNQAALLNGKTNAYGSLAGELALSRQARLGPYNIVAKVDGQELPAGSFQVASFRPPDFRVALSAPAALFSGQAGRAQVRAAYLFGAPLAQGRAAWAVSQDGVWFAPDRLDGYAVGDLPLPGGEPHWARQLSKLEEPLDAQGQADLPVPAVEAPPGQPQRLELEAAVSDASERSVAGRASVLIHPSALYLGLKTPLLAEAGGEVAVEVAAATYDDKQAPPAQVTLVAYRQFWETVRERGPGGFYHVMGQARRQEVWRQVVPAGAWPLTAAFTPSQAGTYVLAAEAADPDGRLTRSAAYLYVSGQGQAGWQRFDDHRLEVEPGLAELKPGDTARLFIKNPFPRATALITLERQGVRRLLVRQVSGPAPVIELPVTAEDAPGVYAGVLLVRGRAAPPSGEGAADLAKPQVRIGYAVLKVADPAATLTVSVTPSRRELRPGEELAVSLAVTRADRPQRAEVLLLAVDERVLVAAGGRDNYDPRQTFADLGPLAVSTMDNRTQVVGQRFAGQKGDASAGGGGAGEMVRRDFHPAVFWLAQAETDEHGALQASFRLPDSLTAYRIVAVAADRGAGFGLGQVTVRARQPLQTLSALPRFAVEGDRLTARVLVQNLSDAPGKAVVEAVATGSVLEGPASREVEVAPGQTVAVGFALLAGPPGLARLTVRARLAGSSDAAAFELPVLPATALTHTAASGLLDPAAGRKAATIPLELPADARPDRGGLTLTLSPSLAAAARPAAELLADYPWDCLEQRLSRAAAWALAGRPAMGLKPQPDIAERLRRTLAQVAEFQTGGGGLAFWPGLEHPDYFLTAYALFAAERLAGSGAALPQETAQRARQYLEQGLKRGKRPAAGDLAGRTAQALAVCVLAAHGGQAGPLLDAAAARLEGLGPFGLAALLEAACRLERPAQAERVLAALNAQAETTGAELSFATVSPGGLKLVLGSRLRGNAFALWVLSRRRPQYANLAPLARWVARELGGKRWLSTQEAAFGLWGLDAWLGESAGQVDLTLTASLAGRELVAHRFDSPDNPPLNVEVRRSLLEPGRRQDLSITADGGGRPLYTATLAWAPAAPATEPVNAGLAVARWMEPSEPPALGRETTLTVSVTVAQTRHQVLVTVPWPAGLEPPEPARGAPLEEDAWASPWRWRELRRDALVLYAPRLDPGVYSYSLRLTAVAPGRFLARPARAEEMYAPHVFGSSGAAWLEVR